MTKTKLPTTKTKRCKNCGAAIIHSYDYFNGVYRWACSGCGASRYEPSAKFAVKFNPADQMTK